MLRIYKASAGSGKTFTLVKEYIRFLFGQPQAMHRHILAVTFTHKATNEMKERIIRQLAALAAGRPSPYRKDLQDRLRTTPDEIDWRARTILIGLLQDYSSFSVSTIDSFFQRIIRSFARELGLSGSYNVELDNRTLLEQAIDNMFFTLDRHSPLFGWLLDFAIENIKNGNSWNIRKDIDKLGEEVFKENYQSRLAENARELHDKQRLGQYKQELYNIIRTFEQQLRQYAGQALDVLDSHDLIPADFKGGDRSPMFYLLKLKAGEIKPPTATFIKCAETAEACYKQKSERQTDIIACYPDLQPWLQSIVDMFSERIIAYNTALITLRNLNTLGILTDISEQIQHLAQEQNTLPIANTNLLLNQVIDESETPFIYEKTGTYFRHYMLDEFQDTSAMQWHNFKPLIQESIARGYDNLVVGDVKQSIYRWRNSDWTLLNGQIQKDIPQYQEDIDTLDTNRRSLREVVTFNNTFFRNAVETLENALTDSLVQSHTDTTGLSGQIRSAYKSLKQKVSEGKEGGYVKMNIWKATGDNKSAEAFRQWAIQETLHTITHLVERGVALHNVAILVRKKSEARLITEQLVTAGYQVVSNEGLSIANASAVRFLIAWMQLLIHPDDTIRHTIVNFEYLHAARRLDESEALLQATALPIGRYAFAETELQAARNARHQTLFDMVDQLIGAFHLDLWQGERVFVQAFQDLIYRFTTEKNADLNSFLSWWEDKGKESLIPIPQMPGALQVMTIHKAKGLEFDHVLLPFCSWKISSDSRNILWCTQPDIPPFNTIETVPVSYSSKLKDSYFSEAYYTELLHSYIDNLNLLYVAFTRAGKELYCMIPTGTATDNIAALLCNGVKDLESTTDETDDALHISIGSPVTCDDKTKNDKSETLAPPYRYLPIGRRLRVKELYTPVSDTDDLRNDRRRLGILMHGILCDIRMDADFEIVVEKRLSDGLINHKEAEVIREELITFRQTIQGYDWFTNRYEIRNEAVILLPDGTIKRPDRLMLAGNKAVIVDYKFGYEELPAYIKQVSEYKSHIETMGYTCTAYICYIELHKVIQIS